MERQTFAFGVDYRINHDGGPKGVYDSLHGSVSRSSYKGVNTDSYAPPTHGTYAGVCGMTYGGGIAPSLS